MIVTTPLFVVVKVPFKETLLPLMEMPAAVLISVGPFKVVRPLPDVWEKAAALRELVVTLLALATEMVPRRVVPTMPCIKILPVPLVKFRSNVPSSVLLKVISPEPVPPVFKVVVPARITGPENRIFALVVLIVRLKETDPPPN